MNYATEMMTIAQQAKTKIEALQAQKQEVNSAHFNKRITDEVHYETLADLDRNIASVRTTFYNDMQSMRGIYQDAAAKWDTLDPEKLTSDVNFLNSPIKLEESDYTKLLEKHKGNRTMLRAIMDAAAANKVEFTTPGGGVLVSADLKVAAFDEFSQSITRGIDDLSNGAGMTFAVMESMTDVSSLDVALNV